jgi:predicted Rdx family selenoprotein
VSAETFDADWLDLREAVDHRSRAERLKAPLRAWWRARQGRRIVDLGAGAGSNLRYLHSVLGTEQHWNVVDHDAGLLSRIVSPAPTVTVRHVTADLADASLREIEGADLVTASALLDLVSADWLRSLAEACAARGCAVLFALTYDGDILWRRGRGAWSEGDSSDRRIRDLVNAHQRRDKGLGPALGPDAAATAEAALRAVGYRTRSAPSPWVLGPEDAELAAALVTGWSEAAVEQRPEEVSEIEAWARRRRVELLEGGLELRVGHADLVGLPPTDAPQRPEAPGS